MEVKTTEEVIRGLLDLIEYLRPKHHLEVEDDCFYSCPVSPDYCGQSRRVCNCGHDQINAHVTAKLKELGIFVYEPPMSRD